MRTSRHLPLLTLILSGLSIGMAFASQGRTLWASATAALTILWGFAYHRRWRTGNSLSFTAFMLLIVIGVWMEHPPVPNLIGLGFALATWDLANFNFETARVHNLDEIGPHLRGHLTYLAVILIPGLAASWIARNLELELDFIIVLILGFMLLLSLKQLIQWGSERITGE